MKFKLEKDMKDLLFYLLQEKDWITSEEISLDLGWNKKKVQQNIKKLSEDLGEKCSLSSKRNKGYLLVSMEDDLKKYLLNDLYYNETYFNLEKRKTMLAIDLLFRNDYIAMEKLAQQYYVSKTVIFEEIQGLKRWFSRIHGLDLEVSLKNGIKLHGDETTKRYWCAVYGQLDILKSIHLPQYPLLKYQTTMKLCSNYFMTQVAYHKTYICGEDFSLILRYVAMTVLRDTLGYALEEDLTYHMNDPLLEQLSKEINYDFSNKELKIIATLLSDANRITHDYKMDYDIEYIRKLENFLLNKLNLKNKKLFENPQLTYQNLMLTKRRITRNRHSVQYYDKNIFIKYPLCIHLATQVFQNFLNITPSRSDILDFAVYLGGIIEKLHLHTSIDVLLIGNQKYEILMQIKNVFEAFFDENIHSFDIYPNYFMQINHKINKHYDLYMTTEPNIFIENRHFLYIPTIMTQNNITRFQSSINKWRIQYDKYRLASFKETIQHRNIANLTHLNELLDDVLLKATTLYVLNKKTLCMIYTGYQVETGTKIYHLKKPLVYEYQSIYHIICITYNEFQQDIVSYFYNVSKMLQEYI